MRKNVLVGFDESENAMRAVDFVAAHFTPEHHVTLFSVIPDAAAICSMNSPGLTPYFLEQRDAFCTLEDKKKEFVAQAMEQAKEKLLKAGFSERNVVLRTDTQKKGIARDILDAASDCDSIVLGRRGLSGIPGFIMGSVSQKVLHGAGEDTAVVLVN
ncbi:MAG: universal stress protein [Desulfobacteraceae bacterium]